MPSAQVPPAPRFFPNLSGGLVGISDRTLELHQRLYARACAELGTVRGELARSAWTPPQDLPVPTAEVQRLLETRVCDLELGDYQIDFRAGFLGAALSQLRGELVAKGISWFPSFYLGEAEYWTADQGTSVNLPWYLGSDVLWQMVNAQVDRYTHEELMMVLRHEAGHAVGYAFQLWRTPTWGEAFGDFNRTYRDTFEIDPTSTDFVRHLHRSGAAANLHYAQKHPDEDWAETFATWLDPGSRWADEYAVWPGALAKLRAVQQMVPLMLGEPTNLRVGRRAPWAELTYTVGEFLGTRAPGEASPLSAAHRREPELSARVALHELYFEQLRRGAGGMGPELQVLNVGLTGALAPSVALWFGSWEAWLADLRAVAGATDGWALAVWNPREGRPQTVLVRGDAEGIPPGCPILIAIDCHEHAYAADHARKDLYLGAFFRNLDWAVVERRFREATAPAVDLPQPWGVVYAPPNKDGSRKSCGNCGLFDGTSDCAILSVGVSKDMVCGYHVNGVPSPGVRNLRIYPVPPDLAGLATIPGGTSCSGCRFFEPIVPGDPTGGLCRGVRAPAFQTAGAGVPPSTPALVQGLGCCARWEARTEETAR